MMFFRGFRRTSLCLTLLMVLSAAGHAAEWSAKQEAKAAPDGVSEPIKALLSGDAVIMEKDGAPELTLWFLKELPLSAKPEAAEKALDQVKESQLLGVVEVHADRRDYRDDEMPAGVYTMRMGLRPNDGDHLGTSDYLYFGVLIPVSKDTKVEAYGSHDALAEASAEETAVFHPSIISLRPDSKPDAAPLTVHEVAEDHVVARVTASGKAGDAAESIAFEVVLEGEAAH